MTDLERSFFGELGKRTAAAPQDEVRRPAHRPLPTHATAVCARATGHGCVRRGAPARVRRAGAAAWLTRSAARSCCARRCALSALPTRPSLRARWDRARHRRSPAPAPLTARVRRGVVRRRRSWPAPTRTWPRCAAPKSGDAPGVPPQARHTNTAAVSARSPRFAQNTFVQFSRRPPVRQCRSKLTRTCSSANSLALCSTSFFRVKSVGFLYSSSIFSPSAAHAPTTVRQREVRAMRCAAQTHS
jgi:hypothetical protein